jgi:hypothetical protein
MTHARTILRLLPLLGGSILATGCPEDEETPKLFDETGAWSLISYNLTGEGAPNDVDSMNRKDAFMLSFDPTNKVVQTAACIDEASGSVTPADSPCLLTPTDTEWVCSCFGYAFENDKMKWREFEAGSMPPVVSFDDAAGDESPPPADDGGSGSGGTGEGGGDESGGPAPGSDFTLTVAEVANVSATSTFLPLPTGVFGSNGTNSRFIFQARAPSLFARAFDDPDGRATCEPCI